MVIVAKAIVIVVVVVVVAAVASAAAAVAMMRGYVRHTSAKESLKFSNPPSQQHG